MSKLIYIFNGHILVCWDVGFVVDWLSVLQVACTSLNTNLYMYNDSNEHYDNYKLHHEEISLGGFQPGFKTVAKMCVIQ